MRRCCLLTFSILLCFTPYTWLHAEPKTFTRDSLVNIEQQYSGQAFLLMLWSLECPPCRDELALIAHLRQQGYRFNLVLLATDRPEMHSEAQQMLVEHQLLDESNWFFSAQPTEFLRHQVDPGWFGELPRSYFYDAAHQRIGYSGKLSEALIKDWLARIESQP